jgi:phosphomannomutase
MARNMDAKIFKPEEIAGVYPDQIDEDDAWKIGSATAQFLRSLLTGYDRGQANMQCLCVGRDMRTHSESLAKALIEGMNSTGANVIDIGMIDTPQMYFAINHLGTCGGVQITASHKPAKHNGFKISGLGAKPVGADTGLKDIKHIALALLHTKGKATGKAEQRDLTADYRAHILKFLMPVKRRLRIAVDASNGMAGKMVPAIFEDQNIEIVEINFKHDGRFRHLPDPLVEKNLSELKRAVETKECDFGVCFDGDADRITMVDESGETIGCDLMIALLVPHFLEKKPNSTIVYDLRSSRVVSEEIIKYGGTPRRERARHIFMKKTMRDAHAVFGGDLSGHFYYRDNWCTDSGLITLVNMINLVGKSTRPISEIVKPLRRYSSGGEISFRAEGEDAKESRMEELGRRYSDGQVDYLDGVTVGYKEWWFNCRPDETEPLLRLNIEAKTEEMLEEKLGEIEAHLGKRVSR